jgi:AraC-like DNA-binding protein
MRANASLPLTITEIADAAGCSVRALQMAFQRFRGTTPMRVLLQVRLEQARSEMLRAGQTESLARIAAEYGFSSPTRFAQSFRRKYGVYPSEMLRERRLIIARSRFGGRSAAGAWPRWALPVRTRLTPNECVFRFAASLFVARRRGSMG